MPLPAQAALCRPPCVSGGAEWVLQRTRERHAGIRPPYISDRGPQLAAMGFKGHFRPWQTAHGLTHPHRPHGNDARDGKAPHGPSRHGSDAGGLHAPAHPPGGPGDEGMQPERRAGLECRRPGRWRHGPVWPASGIEGNEQNPPGFGGQSSVEPGEFVVVEPQTMPGKVRWLVRASDLSRRTRVSGPAGACPRHGSRRGELLEIRAWPVLRRAMDRAASRSPAALRRSA